jgi:hypothetical protein
VKENQNLAEVGFMGVGTLKITRLLTALPDDYLPLFLCLNNHA